MGRTGGLALLALSVLALWWHHTKAPAHRDLKIPTPGLGRIGLRKAR